MKYRLIYFCIAFLLFNCHSNKEKTIHNNKNSFAQLYQKGTHFFHISEYENQNSYDSAVYYLEKYCKLAQNQQDTSYKNVLFQLARSYESIEEIEKADSCFKKAIKGKSRNTNCIYTYWAGINKYNNSSDYMLALDYFQQCLDCQEAIYDYSLYMDIGNVYAELKYTPHFQDSALFYYKKAIYTVQPNILNEVYLSIASFYNDNIAQYDSSLVYFKKIKGKNIPEFYWNNYAKLLRNMGREENNIQKYQTALTFYQRELRLFPEKSPTDKGIIYNEIGFCYLEKAKLQHSLKAGTSVKQEIDSANYYFVHANHFFEEEKSSILWTIRNYSGKGRTHLFNYQLSQNPDNLDQSVDYFAKVLTLMPSLRKKLETEISKSILTDLLYNAYEPALEANYALYKSNPTPENLQSAYDFIQSSKALALSEEMNRSSKEKRSNDTQSIDNQVKIANIQAKCKAENSFFVDYFQGKENVFIFYATAEKQGLLCKKGNMAEINAMIILLMNKMDMELSTMNIGVKNAYIRNNYSLYKTLFADLDSIFKVSSLKYPIKTTLVLDGNLHKIPFDALMLDSLAKPPHYLIEKYNFNYAFSAAMWLQAKPDNATNTQILAMSPVFDAEFDKSYPFPHSEISLDNSFTTLTSLQEKYGITTYFHAQATPNRLRENATKYGLLHLATHAIGNDTLPEKSYLALAPDKERDSISKGYFWLNDIYATKMKASLALLTACETGKGQIKKGEGVMSLARAFRYAGCERIIMTLWSVDEQTTMDITKAFYDNLANGESYSEALHKAKLAQIKKTPDKWAALVLIGDGNGHFAVKKHSSFWGYLLAGGILLLLGGYWFYKSRKGY